MDLSVLIEQSLHFKIIENIENSLGLKDYVVEANSPPLPNAEGKRLGRKPRYVLTGTKPKEMLVGFAGSGFAEYLQRPL